MTDQMLCLVCTHSQVVFSVKGKAKPLKLMMKKKKHIRTFSFINGETEITTPIFDALAEFV